MVIQSVSRARIFDFDPDRMGVRRWWLVVLIAGIAMVGWMWGVQHGFWDSRIADSFGLNPAWTIYSSFAIAVAPVLVIAGAMAWLAVAADQELNHRADSRLNHLVSHDIRQP